MFSKFFSLTASQQTGVSSDDLRPFDYTNTSKSTPIAAGVFTLVGYAPLVASAIWPKEHTRNSNMRAC
jgi:hypothetical protein